MDFEGTSAPFEKWMRLPAMGHVLTSVYQRPVLSLSKELSITFLPYYNIGVNPDNPLFC